MNVIGGLEHARNVDIGMLTSGVAENAQGFIS